ncbi:MAG: DUF5050 domain-containing protein [Firmicutes bacterium]|nr:DUF5050 domain-containing protein [Bacillota bacterium]
MKRYLLVIVLCCALLCGGCMKAVDPIGGTGVTPEPTPGITETPAPPELEVRVYGAEDAQGESCIKCEFSGEGRFVYRFYQQKPVYAEGDPAEGFETMPQDGIIPSRERRRLVIAQLDGEDRIIKYTCFDYIPGISYYLNEGAEYTALLNTVTNTSKEDYSFGYGEPSLGYMEPAAGGVNAGINYYCHADEPFYSPAGGQIIAVESDRVNIYIPEMNYTVSILHFSDVAAAQSLLQEGGTVSAGELLGYTGGNGVSGFPEMHIELLSGKRADYAGYANSLETVRVHTLDPRILFDGAEAVLDPDKPAYVPYSVNAGGNAGYGLAARENGYIYYLNPKDGNRVYRMKNDGTEQEKVTADRAKFLTVCEGWLYYSSPGAGLYFYRCRIDGTDRTLIYKTSMSNFTIVGDTIYLETVTSSQRLHAIKTDGTGYVRISDQKVMSPFYYKGLLYTCAVRKDMQVYTTAPDAEAEGGYSYNALSDMRAANLIVADGYIYFANYRDSNKLYRANLDGSDPVMLADITVSNINYYNGYLYFANVQEYSKIYSCRVDGSDMAQMLDRSYCNDLCIAGDWMFYTANTSSSVTYRYNLITGQEEKVK